MGSSTAMKRKRGDGMKGGLRPHEEEKETQEVKTRTQTGVIHRVDVITASNAPQSL